jgi:uncharacterized protein (DUF924 family)
MDPKAVQSVLTWWFGEAVATTPQELGPKTARWFRDGAKLDAEVREKFGALVEEAVTGGLGDWEATLEGRLALIILLDQFTRHVFRDQPRMYAGDQRAQQLSVALFASGEGRRLRIDWRHFSMMPMLHSEDVALHARSVEEIDAIVAEAPPFMQTFFSMAIEQSRKYRDVIQRFGRFPHRNAILGRVSSPEEQAFLETFVGPPKDYEKKL